MTFAAGVRSAVARFTTVDDAEVESAESFPMQIVSASRGMSFRLPFHGTLTITDNDTSAPVFSGGGGGSSPPASHGSFQFAASGTNYTTPEGNPPGGSPPMNLVVQRTGGSSGTVTIDYATADVTATAGADYSARSGTLTFAPGDNFELLTIPIGSDTADEADETFTVTLSNPTGGGTLGANSSVTVTIEDEDAPPAPGARNWYVRQHDNGIEPRFDGGSAYDAARSRTVVFGGTNSTTKFDDTWEWDGTGWTEATPVLAPSARAHFAMADLPGPGVILFGGASGTGPENDTWVWDGTTWTQRQASGAPGAGRPPSVTEAVMAHHPDMGKVVLFGGAGPFGYQTDTYVWDDVASEWDVLATSGFPPGREGAVLAADGDGDLVLFGGFVNEPTDPDTVLGDTWQLTWDGSDAVWTQVNPAATAPAARYRAAMAFDADENRTVLYGGSETNDFGDTWSWTGSAWVQESPTGHPGNRSRHVMATEPGGDVLLLGGVHDPAGVGADRVFNDVFSYGATRTS